MRLHILGGFLGAGKTTLARALARHLSARGESVAIITNDQGRALVDTTLCKRDRAIVSEVLGGCFCCKYDELEAAIEAARAQGATVAIAEAVGSCTDLISTVVAPLQDRVGDAVRLQPFTVVVDPFRALEAERGELDASIEYLFRKQLEEAEVIATSRADEAPPDVERYLRSINATAPIVALSSLRETGIAEWLATAASAAAPLQIDYDRYAQAEAKLGWFNGVVSLRASDPFDHGAILARFAERMNAHPVAHLKATCVEPGEGRVALVRRGDQPFVERANHEPVLSARWLVNARVALDPAALGDAIDHAMRTAAGDVIVTWSDRECFSPARPTPTHRYASRCAPGEEASCCAAFYERDDVRALLGESWHPGGVELTLSMASALRLSEGQRLLDVACGKGTSLRAIAQRYAVRAVGMDARAHGEPGEKLEFVRADAHAIPFEAQSFDAVLCECALSTFFDQPGALGEIRRVLRPTGRVAISDMVVEGPIPPSLAEWIHTGTCLSRAMTSEGYARALTDAGFTVVERRDESRALLEMLRTIKRNLVGIALAQASGQLAAGATKIDMKYARDTLREAERVVREGLVSYCVIVGEKPTEARA